MSDWMYYGIFVAYPEVIPSINIPLNIVSISLRSKRMVPVRLCNPFPRGISRLLVGFVVPVVWVELEIVNKCAIDREVIHTKLANLPVSCLEIR